MLWELIFGNHQKDISLQKTQNPSSNRAWARSQRVGVFVNADAELPQRLLGSNLIDIAQFHGDETPEYCAPFADAGFTFIKAIGVQK